ncbi:MAG: ribonuclease HII [Flavobacteriales bacterium]|nr:ribonuclease HII [Flavobacteriales bacterium]|tara:strand:- start:1936 stop:2556 length:621 start_codon:yes stop_codon:yes gene_type:complete
MQNKITQYKSQHLICGCDEAGRGALAGPVVAAAVILPKNFKNFGINDSKKLSHKKRLELNTLIKKNSIAWSIGIITNTEIDKINILNASIKAMHHAITVIIQTIKIEKINKLLIDGNKFKKYKNLNHECIIKGDQKYLSIAAASIIAKTSRDELMCKLDKQYPSYMWRKNKGYPTQAHKNAIRNHGPSKYHRKSFKLFNKQYCLEL